MVNNLKNKLFEQGYLKVKNVLNFQRDLKPILNDMEFVMDCLIQKFAKKKDVKKVLNLDFKKKYSYISKLKIDDLDQYFNTDYQEIMLRKIVIILLLNLYGI